MQKPTLNVKVEQVEQENGYVKVGSIVKKSDQVLVVKVKQGNGYVKVASIVKK